MTEAAHSLYAEIDGLAAAVDSLTPRGKAVIFGVCGRALTPLLRQVEQRSQGRFTVPDLDVALDLIQAFATGSAEAADYSQLRARLDRAVSEDEHPWSTYAQDVLICVDAGLAVASAADRPRGILIHFALEPLTAVLEDRGTEIFRTFGRRYWSREIINDPAMAAALGFLHELIAKASNAASVDSYGFRALVTEAAVLRPGPSATAAAKLRGYGEGSRRALDRKSVVEG